MSNIAYCMLIVFIIISEIITIIRDLIFKTIVVMSFVDLLRVPPIFVMDKLFKISFGFPDFVDTFPVNNIYVNHTLNQIENVVSAQYYKAIFLFIIKIIISCLSKFKLFPKLKKNNKTMFSVI